MSDSFEKVLGALAGRKVAVIGDLILDEFVWGRVKRISPEAPVPVVEVERETERLGGAANVAMNLAALGAVPLTVGLIGGDSGGRRFLAALDRLGIDGRGIITEASRRTTIKTRIIAHHQQVCRTDRECADPVSAAARENLHSAALQMIDEADAVILSDYAKGVLNHGVSARLIEACREKGRFVAVDPKQRDFSVYAGASIITPNSKEAETASGLAITGRETLEAAGFRILEFTGAACLLITRGEEGMTLFHDGTTTDIATAAQEVFDVTGAGDTVISTLTAAVAAGASVRDAAILANHAAGVVVGKLGTATASIEEIRNSLQRGR
ncbi:MAG: D-glycero-beta-D-manno-heptose-7-phosphate kinase [Acidobacteriota bacterium]|nr:MAG: D-glycero-beta-D-manno-heptose-7-phosphate kinase [Acidobacteriota bacterium]